MFSFPLFTLSLCSTSFGVSPLPQYIGSMTRKQPNFLILRHFAVDVILHPGRQEIESVK